MCYFIVLLYLLTIVHIVNSTQSLSLTCLPVEEGKETHMTLTWDPMTQMTLKKEEDIVVICQSNQDCELFQPFPYAVISQKQRGLISDSGMESLTIRISNSTRKGNNPTSGVWTLSLVGKSQFVQTNCTVYKRSNAVDCIYEIRNKQLMATCNTSDVFPEAKCTFSLNQPLRHKDLQIDYVHEPDTSNNYRTVCSAALDIQKVTSDKIILNVTMYPNVTGTEYDIQYGTNRLLSSDLSNNVISCSPAKEGEENIVRVSWDSHLPVTLLKDGDLILNCSSSKKCYVNYSFQFTETRKFLGGSSEIDIKIPISTRSGGNPTAGVWTLSPLEQLKSSHRNCSVYSKASDIQCQNESKSDGVTLKCSTTRIYPQAKCIFISKHKNAAESLTYKDINYTETLITGDPVYYSGTCSLHIAWRDLRPNHHISANVYPDVTGTDSDMEYGTVTPIFVVDVLVLSLSNCLSRLERGMNVSCICDNTSVQVSWFDEETHEVISPGAHLSYTATRYEAFRCQPSAKELYVGISETYRPNITYPPVVRNSGDSNLTHSDVPVSIECETEGLDGQQMEIVKKDHETEWLMEEHIRQTESNRELCTGSVFYECVIYDDDNFNRSEHTKHKVPCPDDSSNYNIVLIITYAGVGFLAVLVIIFIVLAVYCKKKRGKKVNSEYSYQSGLKYDNDFYVCYEPPSESTRTSVYDQYL